MSTSIEQFRNLLDRCAEFLNESPSRVHGERVTASIALGFCSALNDVLDEFQLRAVAVARSYWDHGEVEQFAAVLKEAAERVDQDQIKGVDVCKMARNRLVWAALNKNTKFDEYSCEYIVLLAMDSGLEVGDVAKVLANNLHGLNMSGFGSS